MTDSPPPYLNTSSVGHIGKCLRSIYRACCILIFSHFRFKNFPIERTKHIGACGTIHHPLRIIRISINRQFKQLRTFPKSGYMALISPLFQIGRNVNRVSITFIQHHNPVLTGFIPEYFRITRIYTIPDMLRINHRILRIFGKSTPIVKTICYTLHLLIRAGSCISHYHGRNIISIIPCSIFIICHC